MATHRTERVSEVLREELGEMIAYELSDPRISDVAVTEVLLSPDMRHAHVRLHLGEAGHDAAIEALNGARHFLRRQLAERLNLFRVPELHFEGDSQMGPNGRMQQLLKRVRRGRPRGEEDSA